MEPEGQFQGPKWGVFSTILLVGTSFYFMNRNHFIKATSIQNYTLYPRWEVRQMMKIALCLVKPLIILTCRYSLINPVTNKFHFGIVICK